MRISEKTIADIKAQLRIEEIVGDFVSLKKKGGQNMWACCPFPGHNEQTPSFSVHPGRGFYKCFGCGEAGDTIDFLEKVQGMSYPEALEYLAQKYHIPFVLAPQNQEADAQQRYREGLYLLMDVASKHYENLLVNAPQAEQYLKERGIPETLARRFRLGYSLDKWRNLHEYLLDKGYNQEQLLGAGLVIEKEGHVYDRFRDRITFPILDTFGRIVGFGARTITGDGVKYINSPETEIYQKGHHLYGLYQAKEAIRKAGECYVVEGYTDLLALHQIGITHSVASLGTSMTLEQIVRLKRFTQDVILLFDGDEAGIKAILRGGDLLLSQDMNIKVALLTQGEDPASIVQKLGKEKSLAEFNAHQEDFLTFKTKHLLAQSKEPKEKTEAIKSIVHSIAQIPDQVKRAVYMDLCSRLVGLSRELFEAELPTYQGTYPAKSTVRTVTQHFEEAAILSQLLHHGNVPIEAETPLAHIVFQELQEISWREPHYKTLYHMLIEQWQKTGKIDHEEILPQVTGKVKDALINLMAKPYHMSEKWIDRGVVPQEKRKLGHLLEKNIYYLKRLFLQQLIDQEQKRLDMLTHKKDASEHFLLFCELHKLKTEIDCFLGITVSKL